MVTKKVVIPEREFVLAATHACKYAKNVVHFQEALGSSSPHNWTQSFCHGQDWL